MTMLVGRSTGMLAGLAAMGLAGCGTAVTRTVIETVPSASVPTTATTSASGSAPHLAVGPPQGSGTSQCSDEVDAGPATSCPFALAVQAAVSAGSDQLGHVPRRVSAYSPTTHRVYSLTCDIDETPEVACATVGGALVVIRAATPSSVAATHSPSGQSFSGNGTKTIGTIVVSSDSTIEWTDDAGLFEATDDPGDLAIASQAPSGTSDLPAGTYDAVQIIAVGNWTMKIVPN